MPDVSRIRVSVVYAEPGDTFLAEVSLPDGATVVDAIEESGIRLARPDIEIREDRLGVFACKVKFASRLRDGDRVEVYRPLKLDPKEARRKRARAG